MKNNIYIFIATIILIIFLFFPCPKSVLENENWKIQDTVSLLAGIVSSIALVISYNVLVKERSNRQMDFLAEVDKLLISDPSLWAIYDTKEEFLNDDIDQVIQKGKLQAFCYFHLNHFELVFLYPSSNRKARKAWEGYLIHLMVSSSRFREIVEKEISSYTYSESYLKILRKLLSVAEMIKPCYEDYAKDFTYNKENIDNEKNRLLFLKRKKYYDQAKKIISTETHLLRKLLNF